MHLAHPHIVQFSPSSNPARLMCQFPQAISTAELKRSTRRLRSAWPAIRPRTRLDPGRQRPDPRPAAAPDESRGSGTCSGLTGDSARRRKTASGPAQFQGHQIEHQFMARAGRRPDNRRASHGPDWTGDSDQQGANAGFPPENSRKPTPSWVRRGPPRAPSAVPAAQNQGCQAGSRPGDRLLRHRVCANTPQASIVCSVCSTWDQRSGGPAREYAHPTVRQDHAPDRSEPQNVAIEIAQTEAGVEAESPQDAQAVFTDRSACPAKRVRPTSRSSRPLK